MTFLFCMDSDYIASNMPQWKTGMCVFGTMFLCERIPKLGRPDLIRTVEGYEIQLLLTFISFVPLFNI